MGFSDKVVIVTGGARNWNILLKLPLTRTVLSICPSIQQEGECNATELSWLGIKQYPYDVVARFGCAFQT
jgi:hypothetical protein